MHPENMRGPSKTGMGLITGFAQGGLGWGSEKGLRKGMRLEKEARNGKDQGIKEACRGEGAG